MLGRGAPAPARGPRMPEDDLESALSQAMRENMLDEVYRETVRRLLDRQDDFWRRCCGSNCDPCALTLARVVDRVRELTGTGPRQGG